MDGVHQANTDRRWRRRTRPHDKKPIEQETEQENHKTFAKKKFKEWTDTGEPRNLCEEEIERGNGHWWTTGPKEEEIERGRVQLNVNPNPNGNLNQRLNLFKK